MHEFGIANDILRTCIASAEHHNAKKVTEIYLEIGDFTLIVEDMLTKCFEIACKGTIADGVKIQIKRTPGVLKCKEEDCGKISEIWFGEEKRKEEEEKARAEQNKQENSELGLPKGAGYQLLGMNLFQCRFCGSKNTELTKGKELKIKNIKVSG
ncbi:MAG: hydrogenase maturation nickel metallochaperone HypA/HybF [Promethearchaeota archaeon]